MCPCHTTLTLLLEVQTSMEKDHVQPKSFKDRIIFISMCNDVGCGRKGNEESCESNSSSVAKCARKFLRGHCLVLRTWIRRKWHATLIHKPDVSWNRIAEQMMIILAESGHLVFRGTSSVSRGTVKAKVVGKHGTYCACILSSARCLRSHCGLLAR